MKKCLKCGAKFEDRFGFCPECGEKLVPSNECPNCHLELAPNAKFCPNCGTRIGEQPQPEPQPEPMPAPAPQAAPQPQPAPQPAPAPQPQPAPAPQQPYGQPYPQQGYYGYQQPAPQPKPQRQKNTNVMNIICRFVFMGMFILAAIFYLIGLLGAPVPGANFTIFFDYSMFQYYKGALPFYLLFYLTYYLAFVGFFVCIGIGIPAIIKAFKGEPIKTKPLTAIAVFNIPYLFFFAYMNMGAYGGMGWGTVMLLVAIILASLTIATLKALGGELKVKPILANAFSGTSFLFVALAITFGTLAGAVLFATMLQDASNIKAYIEYKGFFFCAMA